MNHDLDDALLQDQDLNDRAADQQFLPNKGTGKSFGLIPAKTGSRIQKIKNALIDTNDENKLPQTVHAQGTTDFDSECRKLRDSYSQHKKQRKDSKSRTRSNNTREVKFREDAEFVSQRQADDYQMFEKQQQSFTQFTATTQVNKYKRSTETGMQDQTYQSKYQKLEENFKKFTRTIQDKRSSKSPVEHRKQKENSLERQVSTPLTQPSKPITVLGIVYMKPESKTTPNQKPINDRQQALRSVLRQTQHFLSITINELHQLSVSKAQEQELQELQLRLSDCLSGDDERLNLEELFVSFTNQLQTIFSKIM